MAAQSTLLELSAGIEAAARNLSGPTMQQILKRTTDVYLKVVKETLAGETNGSMRLRGGGLAVLSEASATQGRVWVEGPWWLVDQPTAPHTQAPRSGGKRTSGNRARPGREGRGSGGGHRRRALHLSDGEFRARVHHPGTRGKNRLAPALQATQDDVEKVAGDLVLQTLRENLAG